MKQPFSYYGGKQNMAKHILPIIPSHRVYVEPFFGGGTIFFQKPPSELEVINDRLDYVINFYKVIKDSENLSLLCEMLDKTLYSESEYKRAAQILKNAQGETNINTAWALFVCASIGFSGKIFGGFGFGKNLSTNIPKSLRNKIETFIKTDWIKRMQNCYIFCRDAVEVIQIYDQTEAFFYIDPPYVGSNCGHYEGYTINDFENLLKTLSGIKGKFLLSSYPSETLANYTKENNWHTQGFELNITVDNRRKEKKKKIEVLTMNYKQETNQTTLF